MPFSSLFLLYKSFNNISVDKTNFRYKFNFSKIHYLYFMKSLFVAFLVLPFVVFAQQDDEKKAFELYGEGIKYFYSNDFENALVKFNEAIALKQDFQYAYYNRGLSQYKLKNYTEAATDLSVVLKLDSNNIDAYKNRGLAYMKINEYDNALSDFQHLIAFNPSVLEPYKYLGLCYYYKRKYKLANEAFSIYLESYFDDTEVWFQKGLSNYYYADFDVAIKDFTEVLNLNANYITALEWRGKAYQKANLIKKACEDWNTAVSKNLESSKALLQQYCEQ